MNIHIQLHARGGLENQSRKLIFWSWKSGEVEGSLAEVGGEEAKDDDEEKKEGNSVNHLLLSGNMPIQSTQIQKYKGNKYQNPN